MTRRVRSRPTRETVSRRLQQGGSRSGLVRFALSIAVSVVLVAVLLRQVPASSIVSTLRDVHMPGLALGALTFAAMVAARVARYRLLLAHPVGLFPLTLITLVRGMLADLLPARLGTLSYIYLARSRARVPLDDAMASFLLAFVFDMVAIAPLLILAILVTGSGLDAGVGILVLAVLLFVGALAGVWLLGPALRWAAGVLAAREARAPSPGFAARAAAALSATAQRVEQVRERGVLVPVFVLSLLVRLTKFAAHYFVLQAVLVPLGVAWGTLSFFEAFLGIAGAELSAMLPVSGIAAFGTWELAWTTGFTRLGLSQQQAIVSGFATHIVIQLHDYTLGAASLVILMWPASRSKNSSG